MISRPSVPRMWWGVYPGAFSHAYFWAVAPGFHIPAANKQTTIWTVLVTTIMPASPNDQTPSPITDIRLSSPFLDTLQPQSVNPSKTVRRERQQRSSSPLARGTHCGWLARRRLLGLIPVRAGNTRKTAYLSFFPLTSTPCGRGVPLPFQPQRRDSGGFSSRHFIHRRTSDSK